MILIKPKEISGKIMTLIDESDEYFTSISPYYKFENWNKLIRSFENAIKRNVKLNFYVREDAKNDQKELENFGFEFITIPMLHAKIYFNEKQGIVSSMNLYRSSDEKSIDIAYMTESKEEYQELLQVCKRHIISNLASNKSDKIQVIPSSFIETKVFTKSLKDKLKEGLNSAGSIHLDSGTISFKYGTKISMFIYSERGKNKLRIKGILSTKNVELIKKNNFFDGYKNIKFEVVEKISSRYYNYLWATFNNTLKSESLAEIFESEAPSIIDVTYDFANLIYGIQYQEMDKIEIISN